MKKIFFGADKIIVLILLMCIAAGGCKKNSSGLDLSSPVSIISFTANGAKGVINDTTKTISVLLPLGSNLSSIAPIIALPNGGNISPASGTQLDFTVPVTYKVVNGNLYSTYTVTAKVETAFSSFTVNGVAGVIDDVNHTITVTLPPGSNLTALSPQYVASPGLTVSPASGSAQNFTSPVIYSVTSSVGVFKYTVNVQSGIYLAYLGASPTRAGITNADEKAAADWFFSTYAYADYVSFNDIQSGTVTLTKYKAIWWHYDSAQSLPNIAYDNNVVTRLKGYYAAGGNFFLTSFAAIYLPTLGIVPPGKGSNNVFGDATPNTGGGDWGINFTGNETHPLFQGLTLASNSVAYLLGKDAERLNHTAWWKVSDWGGYTDAAGWRAATGGIDLATVDGDNNRNSTCSIAEFPSKNGSGKTISISMGAYDWYAEPNPATNSPSAPNIYLPNIKRMSLNGLNYLTK